MKQRLTVVVASVLVLFGLLTVPASAQATYGSWCLNKSDFAVLGASSEVGVGKTGYTGKGADGISGTADDGFYEATPYGWTTKLSQNLKAEWGSTMQNYSRAGAFVSDYLPGGRWPTTTGALADMTSRQSDLAILDLGGNEYLNQISPDTFEANLRTLVTGVKAARPDMDVLLLVHHKIVWPFSGTPQYQWQDYASRIGAVAVSTPTALIDLRQYIPSLDANPLPKYTVWDADKIHLNDNGDLILHSTIWSLMIAWNMSC